MPIPEHVRGFIDAARFAITRASFMDGRVSADNAIAHLGNAYRAVQPTGETEAAFSHARRTIKAFGSLIAGNIMLSDRERDSVEDAKQLALDSIEGFVALMSEARLSKISEALGFGPL